MGQISRRADILTLSTASPAVVVTDEAHGYATGDFVRLTNLNGAMPVHHGQDPLNNHRYRIVVTGNDAFYLQDPITQKDIDSTMYPPYTLGGLCNFIQTDFIYTGE